MHLLLSPSSGLCLDMTLYVYLYISLNFHLSFFYVRSHLLFTFSSLIHTYFLPLDPPGVAIVSEFISSARVMRGALIVNPWKVDEVCTSTYDDLIQQ